ncbi:hypothetical protein ACFQH5_20200 [Halomonas salifodinae]|uniref:Uncharacterized protein n=2 Tax=Halomonas salifodinae TaxID=438745 RepID=A0ABW2F1E3_9GAMM
MPQKQADIVPLHGGIDQASTVLNIKPGSALDLINFEPELEGGYRRIAGYERVDGRAAPSDALYYTVEVVDSSGIAVGATLTGGTSGATSQVVIKDDATNTLGVTALSGSYTLNEAANGTTITAVEVLNGQDDNDTSDIWQMAAEDYYRNLIGAVPGDGDALYAFQFGATRYAFRADAGTVKLYKSSATGWTLVPFFDVLFFDGGTMAEGEITAGTVINGATSGAQGTVKVFVKNAGSYGTNASGYMVLDVTTGTFQDNEDLTVSASIKAKADGASTAITLATGGTFQHITHNFYATATGKAVYGCDGVNPAWEFDGTILTPIYYPAPDENPSWNKPLFVVAHKMHLFLAYEPGTLAHSSIGDPLVFSAILGAGEFGLGDEPTGMASRAGEVLAIYTRSKTYGLYGSSAADWDLKMISETFGAKPYTVQEIGTVYALDDKGIAPLERVQAFGDFESATVSRYVREILNANRGKVLGSVTVKERNQYRLHFTDGRALVMTFDSYVGSDYPAFSVISYSDTPTFVSSSQNASGDEVVLFGDSAGFIYQAERGYSFDGDAIEFVYRTPFLNQRSPHIRKTYRDLYVDVEADHPFSMSVTFDLSFSEIYSASNGLQSFGFAGGGGYWNDSNWDEFRWDAEVFSSRGVPIAGSGRNISLLFYGNSKFIRPFTIQTLELHYLARRLRRGR